MKTNELRIGNWIMGIGCMRVTELKTELGNNFITASNKDVVYMDEEDNFQPIELTEEVLLKIGFKKVFQSAVTKGRFELNINIGDYEFVNMVYHIYKSGNPNFNITQRRCASLCDNSIYKNNVKYLHELQNAYYCLTGEELNIEL